LILRPYVEQPITSQGFSDGTCGTDHSLSFR
jgi:hypothetical protein